MAQVQTQEKPVTYTVQILGSNGVTYTAGLKEHRDWLWKQLGINEVVECINKLEIRVNRLEAPVRQQKILDLLKNEPSGRTLLWIQRRLNASWSDVSALKETGRLEHFMVGNSHKYRVKEQKP